MRTQFLMSLTSCLYSEATSVNLMIVLYIMDTITGKCTHLLLGHGPQNFLILLSSAGSPETKTSPIKISLWQGSFCGLFIHASFPTCGWLHSPWLSKIDRLLQVTQNYANVAAGGDMEQGIKGKSCDSEEIYCPLSSMYNQFMPMAKLPLHAFTQVGPKQDCCWEVHFPLHVQQSYTSSGGRTVLNFL